MGSFIANFVTYISGVQVEILLLLLQGIATNSQMVKSNWSNRNNGQMIK